jgi:hypothetical protein
MFILVYPVLVINVSQITVFWYVTQCSLVHKYRLFSGTHCSISEIILLPCRWSQHIIEKHRYPCSRLHGGTLKKTVAFIFISIRISFLSISQDSGFVLNCQVNGSSGNKGCECGWCSSPLAGFCSHVFKTLGFRKRLGIFLMSGGIWSLSDGFKTESSVLLKDIPVFLAFK